MPLVQERWPRQHVAPVCRQDIILFRNSMRLGSQNGDGMIFGDLKFLYGVPQPLNIYQEEVLHTMTYKMVMKA